jgi:hypothetical protein
MQDSEKLGIQNGSVYPQLAVLETPSSHIVVNQGQAYKK